jgi:hypothetical protein
MLALSLAVWEQGDIDANPIAYHFQPNEFKEKWARFGERTLPCTNCVDVKIHNRKARTLTRMVLGPRKLAEIKGACIWQVSQEKLVDISSM